MPNTLGRVSELISHSQHEMADLLRSRVGSDGISREQYCRYLQMQYHMTKGVQKHFFLVAAHSSLERRHALRAFLFQFACEEESHFRLAKNDLAAMGQEPGSAPLDVVLWKLYFASVLDQQPFIRLGATCILENLSAGLASVEIKRALNAPFLDRDNTRFVVVHQHEVLPHGDQIVQALSSAKLDRAELRDLEAGAEIASQLYMRLASWALTPSPLALHCAA